ncbi:MAG: hypothetical protein KDD46_05060, partial [Bdellovibrionales bacterium]|nr:hypothetical protein [Bdellovibrionales bacterium]
MVKISFQHIKEKYGRFILVGLCVFLIGLVIHFPVHRLAPMITSMIERNSGYQIQASQMSIVMPFGLSMKDVWIQGPPIMNVPVNHKFESVKLYPSITSLLTYVAKKSLGVSFKADRGAEKWNGSVALGPKYTDVSLRGSDLDYSFIVPLEQYNPMLAGQTVTISSRFRFELDFEAPTPDLQLGDFTKATGALSL